MKEKALLFGWIAGLLLIISLFWIFTHGLQTHYLLRTVNNVLISKNDPRRLNEHLNIKSGKSSPLGFWYSMYGSTDNMFIFSVFQDGILIPLGAIVSSNGDVTDIIPLSAHATQVFNNMPKSILQVYINKIEGNK